ncbi:MAG: caspase family protein [Chlamydiales bacterium]|nr:caspase family protein [Chlamydiales bacterium]
MKKLLFSLTIALSALSAAYGYDIHAFLVCDTHSDGIGYSVRENLDNMRSELQKAAQHANANLIEHIYSDDKATTRFLKGIQKLKVDHDDVVIFYWAGHGFRTYSKSNPWPNFAFYHDDKSVDQWDVTEMLMRKHPRLILSIADTCNSYVADEYAPHVIHKRRSLTPYNPNITTNYQALFNQCSGTYIISSSSPGESSWYKRSGGGFFTNALLESIREATEVPPPIDWVIVFDSTAAIVMTTNLPEGQNPQYQVLEHNLQEYEKQ